MECAKVGKVPNFEDKLRVVNDLGMCIWSFPYERQEQDALEVIAFHDSGFNVAMPYPNLPMEDQPALFFKFLDIYRNAKREYDERKGK